MASAHPVAMIYRRDDSRSPWGWRIKARNGKIIAAAGEGFRTRRNAQAALDTLLEAASTLYRLD